MNMHVPKRKRGQNRINLGLLIGIIIVVVGLWGLIQKPGQAPTAANVAPLSTQGIQGDYQGSVNDYRIYRQPGDKSGETCLVIYAKGSDVEDDKDCYDPLLGQGSMTVTLEREDELYQFWALSIDVRFAPDRKCSAKTPKDRSVGKASISCP